MTTANQDRFWELASAKMHDEITDKELPELKKFMKNRKNRETFKRLKQIKIDLEKIKILFDISQINSWNNITGKVKNKTIRVRWNIIRYAAIIILAFGLGSFITNQLNKPNKISGFTEVKVPLGQMSKITLSDGTTICLNSGTTLRYKTDFGEKARQVLLEGEAFFDVAQNGTPFRVNFKNQQVEVLGTRFNVVAYKNENISKVTLVKGKVNINNFNGTRVATLKPSQQITINEQSKNATIANVETNFYVSWIKGKIIFDDEKLVDITNKLERWYNVDIEFTDESIKELRFSGTILKNKPFDQIITAFELLLPIKIKYTHILGDKNIVIIKKNN